LSWFAVAGVAVVLSLALGLGAARGTGSRSGGTLRVVQPVDFASLDPALARPLSAAVWYATCATLTAFRDAPAPAGLTTRPEAAAGPPQVSKDGLTYVFTVRQGLRFSDGSPLTAANFATALARVLDPAMQSYWAYVLSDVTRFRANGQRLVIELSRPSGDLTTRLALPFACPVPLGFPVDPAGVPLMVGSGPYYIASHDPDRSLVLARNPYYRGSRPHWVDRVVITVGGDLNANIQSVEQGDADVLGIEMPRDVRDSLVPRYGVNKQQLFRTLGNYTGALVLNTSRPLFQDNVALRKAVNFALDRTAIGLAGGDWQNWFTATDQILPRSLPGWTDYDLYPLAHPDLQRARALASGHLRGGKAVLYTCTGKLPNAFPTCTGLVDQAAVIAQNLKEIGLDVEVKVLDANVLFASAGTPGEPYDMLLADFGSDYPDPANMIVPYLAGENARKPSGNTNLAYFDVPRYNREIATADRLVGGPRFRAFSRLDAEIMREQAPWAPLFEGSSSLFLSTRVGCLKVQPFSRDYAAMCVR
jgi:peptide/nickel transport system substrate-binding protein